MTNVVVVGAGKRALGAVLPALHCLGEPFHLVGVVARSAKEVSYGCGRTTTVASLDAIDLAHVDLIITAISIDRAPAMLADLARRPVARAVLLHDTPVLQPKDILAARHFAAFRRAVISEDNLALPPLLLAHQLIEDGAIGALRRIYFFHNGFKHHALASMKLLAGSPIRRIVSRRFAGKMRCKAIDFDNRVTAVMYEPRDYSIGKFLLEGERGVIADYDYAGGPVRRIGYLADGPIYRGLTLDGQPVPARGLDDLYRVRIGASIPEASLMNTMKVRGLMDVIAGAVEDRSPFHYAPAEALADHLAIRISDRIGYAPAQRILAAVMPLAQRLRRATNPPFARRSSS